MDKFAIGTEIIITEEDIDEHKAYYAIVTGYNEVSYYNGCICRLSLQQYLLLRKYDVNHVTLINHPNLWFDLHKRINKSIEKGYIFKSDKEFVDYCKSGKKKCIIL